MKTNILFTATFYIVTNWATIHVVPDPSCPSNAIPNRFVITQQMAVCSNVIYSAGHKGDYMCFSEIFPVSLTNAPTRTITNTVQLEPLWFLSSNSTPAAIINTQVNGL